MGVCTGHHSSSTPLIFGSRWTLLINNNNNVQVVCQQLIQDSATQSLLSLTHMEKNLRKMVGRLSALVSK